uniref:Uncharacterized protein n=1 Tax=Avena sativa TaxID=4498 RepID=A0ACD5X718_AVESA
MWSPVAGVMRVSINLEVEIMVLISFGLQLFLLMFAGMRRQNIAWVLTFLLWLAYLLADYVAIYALGHMSFRNMSHEHQQLVVFWAPFLLVHLGGQDTITAFAMEDNQLWRRHLLNLIVQTAEVAYVLYKYIAGSGILVTPAILVLVAGVLKCGERVWALKSASLDDISKFLDDVEKPRVWKAQGRPFSVAQAVGSEEVLQGAHDLLPICMGQFVDYKFWPSVFQRQAIKLFCDKGHIYKLIEMQLSLMHDILYTKATVIHTWYGCFIRTVSLVAVITAFFQFQSSASRNDFNRVDVVVTYILLGGALLLETVAVLRATVSTWTCALLSDRRCHRLYSIAVSVRRCLKAAERNRRWSGSIGQHTLLIWQEERGSRSRNIAGSFGWMDLWGKLHHQSWRPIVISDSIKELVLKEVRRMVEACEGKEEIMRTYNGQCALKPYDRFKEDPASSVGIGFDEKILTWHFATEVLMSCTDAEEYPAVVEAILALSRYMLFLLVERPNMLPSPVSSRLYDDVQMHIRRYHVSEMKEFTEEVKRMAGDFELSTDLFRGLELATQLMELGMPEVLQVVLGVWVEMLCYAAHHCSRDSHARQLNNGGDFITVVWLLTTAIFNRQYCDDPWFTKRVFDFFKVGV